MKIVRFLALLLSAILLVFITVWIYPTPVQSQVTIISQSSSISPRKVPPSNETRPGGGLNPEKLCGEKPIKKLTALVPINNPVLTTSEHPTFLFYIPYKSTDIIGDFSILTWPGETTRIGNRRFKLPNTPGIVSVSLSSSSDGHLEDDKDYHWYLKLYCKNDLYSEVSLSINGFVQKVALTPERERLINTGDADIWYDSLANLAKEIQSVSQPDASLNKKWLDLLTTIHAEDLAQEKLLGSVSFKD